MKRLPPNTRKHFNRHLSVRKIEALILQHHHPIREQFQTGLGLALQFIESQVLVRCLLQLIDRGLSALPVHDALLVPQSQVAVIAQVMRDCFRDVVGVEAALSIAGESKEGLSLPSPLLPPAGLLQRPPGLPGDTLGGRDGGGDDEGIPSTAPEGSTLRSPIEGRVSVAEMLAVTA